MRDHKPSTDPFVEEKAPPYGGPETAPPPPWYVRLAAWYLKPAVKTLTRTSSYSDRRDTETIPTSTAGRRIRIVAFALATVHGVVGLPLLWFALITSAASDSGVWIPAVGFLLIGLFAAMVGSLTYLADE